MQQPGSSNGTTNNGLRKHANESDYEEIGPPPPPSSMPTHANATGGVCDLCGTATAMVRCGACSEQIFCLACDDMYHRHPKRTSHARKALGGNSQAGQSQPIRPPLPPKADAVATPVAPPRKNIRKGSAPDSPVTPQRYPGGAQSSTLPRKAGSMVGRPLPPPPLANNPPVQPGPPALPAKNVNPAPPPLLPHQPTAPGQSQSQPQPHSFYPNDSMQRKMSTTSQPPLHFSYPTQPDIPLPGYPGMPTHPSMPGNSFTLDRRMMPSHQHGYPNAFAYPNRMPHTMEPHQHWKQGNPYLEEMQFATGSRPSMLPDVKSGAKRATPANKRSQFVRLNKSSSLHDIAHEEMSMRQATINDVNNGGISWVDEPWNTTQSTMNQPTMNVQELLDQQRNFRRASSTKSLHQTSDEMWNANSAMWNSSMMNPMVNPMMFTPGKSNFWS